MAFPSLPRILVAATLALGSGAHASEWHVNPAGTGDFPTIQAAFDAASPGDTILLEPGIYTDSVTRTVQGYSSPRTTTAVAFATPAVSVAGTGGAESTIIDGQSSHHGLVGADLGSSSVSGITFLACQPAGGENWGGAVLLYRSGTSIENCRFVGCMSGAGGAVMIAGGSNAVVRSNFFQGNHSGGYGGALEIVEHAGALLENNTFVWNESLGGSALMLNSCAVDLSNNIFAYNFGGDCVACIGGTTATAACDLYWSNSAADIRDCGFAIGQSDIVHADPLFCDPGSVDFRLQADSPAAPAHSGGCGLRGAFPVDCAPDPVAPDTWGHIKAAYR